MQLLEWQFLIFLVPIALGALYVFLMALGATAGEHSADVHADADGHVAVEHDLGAEHAHGLGHGHAEHEMPAGFWTALIGFLGVGKVPLSILLMSYCFVWGLAGLAGVTLLGKHSVAAAIGIAAAAAVFITRYVAAGLSRVIPSVASYHTPARELVGLHGEVLYEVTDSSGQVRVRDERRELRDVSCRVAPGRENIPAGTRVILLRYDAAAQVFVVEPATSEGVR